MPRVQRDTVRARAARLREAGTAALAKSLARRVGTVAQVLIERDGVGRTEHYAPVRFDGAHAIGSVVPMRLASSYGAILTGCRHERDRENRRSLFGRLRAGLSRSSAKIGGGITGIFTKRRLDDEALHELEELLISADLGWGLAKEATTRLRHAKFNQEVSPDEIRETLAQIIEPFLLPVEQTFDARSRQQADRHSGGRRQWQRQDHDHRQAGQALSRRGQKRRSGGAATRSAPPRSSSSRSGANARACR